MAISIPDGENMPVPVIASYILAALAVPVVLRFHLLPTVFAGLAVHVLTITLARRLPRHLGGIAHQASLAVIVVGIIVSLSGIGFWLWSFVASEQGISALLAAVAETLDNLQRSLPPWIADFIPGTVEELRVQLVSLLREHRQGISAIGMEGLRFFVHVLIGMVIGGMTALHHFTEMEERAPFTNALQIRLRNLVEAFEKIVFAQIKISAINTLLTGLYLLALLPMFGVHVPMRTILVLLTFITGLLPVLGNLISNSVIVLISLGVSPATGLASIVFLVVIHKLEYFTNAKIVGGEVHATAWELLCAMIAMESVFGIVGLVAAPVAYAWLKTEVEEGAPLTKVANQL